MSIEIPASHHDLAYGKHTATFVTLLPDGSPHATAVWRIFDDDGFIKISTHETTQKARNAQRDKRVNVMIINPENSGQYIEIRGEVEKIEDGRDGTFVDRLAHMYIGAPWYGNLEDPANRGKPGRVVIWIKPTRVVAR